MDLSEGKTLVHIASDNGISYEALRRRFGRYVKSGTRKQVTDKMINFGILKEAADPRERAKEILSQSSAKKKK